jgi:hypothetical protein
MGARLANSPATGITPVHDRRRSQSLLRPSLVVIVFALSIVGYPLAGLLAPYLDIADSLVSMAFRILVVALAVLAVATVRPEERTAPSQWLLIFFAAYLARLSWDWLNEVSPDAEEALLYFVVVCAIPALAVHWSARRWDEAQASFTVVVVAAIGCAMAWWSLRAGFGETDGGRLMFDKLNPISVGHMGVTTLLACIALLPQIRLTWVRLAVLIGLGGVGIYMAVLGASRGPIVAMVAAVGFLVCVKYRKWWIIVPVVLPLLWLLIEPLLADAGMLEALRLSTILNALQSGDAGYDVTSNLRLESIGEAWDRFTSNPLFGSRFDLEGGGYPHNLWIEAGMAMGIAGLVLISGCLLISLRRAWQLVELDHWLLPLLFVQYTVGAMFSGAIWGSGPFWTVLAPLLVAAHGAARTRPAALSFRPISKRY